MNIPKSGNRDENWNFSALLGQSIFFSLCGALTSPRLVLPFLYTAVGGPAIFAGLLLPIVQVSKLFSQIAAVPIVGGGGLRKFYVALGTIAFAGALAVAALATKTQEALLLVAIFLLVAMAIGIANGLSSIAYWDLFGKVVPSPRQSTLVFSEAAISAGLAIVIALASQRILAHDSALDEHLELMWLGIIMALMSCIIVVLVREFPPDEPSEPKVSAGPSKSRHFKEETVKLYRQTVDALQYPWFRQFNIARAYFLSVELAMPFYVVHAAGHHAEKHHSMSTFVIASSAGVIAGSFLLQALSNRSLTATMVLSPMIACMGGVVAIVMEVFPETRNVWVYGTTFMLLAFAAVGTSNARTLYLVRCTNENERPQYLAVSNVLTGIVGIVVAFLFGTLGHLQGAIWPVIGIVAVNILASVYALRLDMPEPADKDAA